MGVVMKVRGGVVWIGCVLVGVVVIYEIFSGSSERACLRKFGRACSGSSKGQDIQRRMSRNNRGSVLFFFFVRS